MQGKVISLNEALDSKIYVKDGAVEFKSPRDYLGHFIDKLDPIASSFDVHVSGVVQNKEEEEKGGALNTSYGRILLEAHLGKFSTDLTHGKIGIVYALDVQKPVIKVFSGQRVFACSNLCIFNHEYLYQQDLLAGMSKVNAEVDKMVGSKEKELAEYMAMYERMHDRVMKVEEIDELMGRLMRKSFQAKLGSTVLLNAVKLINDKTSSYAIQGGRSTQWNVYNSITQGITDKVDILDQPSKTLALSSIFFD